VVRTHLRPRIFGSVSRTSLPSFTSRALIDRVGEALCQRMTKLRLKHFAISGCPASAAVAEKAAVAIRPIPVPTLVIWGERDRYLSPELAEPDHDDVPSLDRVKRLPDASGWVHHDEAERVTQLLTDFFAPALPARSRPAASSRGW
jgi:pimeloyl-ACP methyl ester carboxylesterase